MSITTTHQEKVMSNTVPAQHPAVVLRSHYRNLRSLLAVALVAIVGLTTTVVVLATDEDQTATTATSIHPATTQLSDPFQGRTQPTRDTGKPDESAVAAAISQQPPVLGPDESAVAAAISQQPQTAISRPDESKIAAAIAEHSDSGPLARDRAYDEALRSMTPEQLRAIYGSK
jgi:hypothetical protein